VANVEISKQSLDQLPKLGFEYLREHFEEGDILHVLAGYRNLSTYIRAIEIRRKGSVVLQTFTLPHEHDRQVTVTTTIDKLLYYMTYFLDQMLYTINNSALRFPPTMRDAAKRRSVLQTGDRTARYKLEKKDGRAYEILT
jgi:hypothetical protein